jgi:hypothetical protein
VVLTFVGKNYLMKNDLTPPLAEASLRKRDLALQNAALANGLKFSIFTLRSSEPQPPTLSWPPNPR